MAYVLDGKLVITKREDGSDHYVYGPSELPDFVDKNEVKRLTDLGLVASSEKAAAKQAADSE